MDYRIIQKEAFKVIGKVINVSTKDEGHHTIISDFWEKCNVDGTNQKICAIDKWGNFL